jgi:hypothetical protein
MADARNFGTQIDCNAALQKQRIVVNVRFESMIRAIAQGIAQTPAFQILKCQCVAGDDSH